MDEETAIINTNTRNQKIKDFFLKNKKSLITISVIIVVLLVSYFSYIEIKKYNKSKLAEKYNQIILS
jgi:predicted negative regulator of RcsB-dependent stress response